MSAPSAGPAASVRPARADDAARVAALQAGAWRQAYAGSLPPDVLGGMRAQDLEPAWREAVLRPPSARHRVLVALAGGDPVGFAALGPAEDADLDAGVCGELLALAVDAGSRGEGHGSRLLQAAADLLGEAGATAAVAWVGDAEADLAAFLGGAGWAGDGAARTLDVRGDGSLLLHQHRWATVLPAPPGDGGR